MREWVVGDLDLGSLEVAFFGGMTGANLDGVHWSTETSLIGSVLHLVF